MPAPPPLVAIDFETANEQRASACSIGLCRVEDGRIVWTAEHLIRPPELRFTPFTIAIHGIRPEDVADAPEFPDVWDALRPALEGAVLLAHNASFDMGVLRAMLETYGLGVPDHGYLCTLVAARRAWPDLEKHKLNHLARHFGIELEHHRAGSDARACAGIVLRAMADCGAADPAELAEVLGIGLGALGPGTHQPCRALPRRDQPRPAAKPVRSAVMR